MMLFQELIILKGKDVVIYFENKTRTLEDRSIFYF